MQKKYLNTANIKFNVLLFYLLIFGKSSEGSARKIFKKNQNSTKPKTL